MLEFFRANSGGLHNVDLATLPSDMLHYYANSNSIPKFILDLEHSREKLIRGEVPMADATVLATAHSQIMGSLHYPEAVQQWEFKQPAAKTWAAWQVHFREANIAHNRLLKANPLAFGAANHVTESIDTAAITMALDNIANAATNNSNVIAALMARINALESRLSTLPATAIIPFTGANNTIIPFTGTNQNTVPYVPRVYTQADALAIFDVNGYCWTHGWRVHQTHTSGKCKKKKKGYKDAATRANTMGGSNTNKGWRRIPIPCDREGRTLIVKLLT